MAALIIDLAGDDLGKAFELLVRLGWYSLTLVIALIIHVFLVYSTMFKIFSKEVGLFNSLGNSSSYVTSLVLVLVQLLTCHYGVG